jgi:AraC-like DNA-binding protein
VSSLDVFVQRVPAFVFFEKFAQRMRESGDPDLGVRIGNSLGARCMGLLGFAVATAPTLGRSLSSLAHWEPMIGRLGRVRVERVGQQVHLTWNAFTGVPTAVTEGLLAGWISMGRFLSGERLPVIALECAHSRPSGESESILECPVRFGAAANRVVAPLEVLEARSRYANERMHAALTGWLDECAAVLTGSCWAQRAALAIADEMGAGGQLEKRVAEHLYLTPRTLQRRLAESGVGFRRLRDLMRANFALARLAHDAQGCAQISQSLGFEEQASFSRAVRQWTQHSPREVLRLFDDDYSVLRRA